MNATPAERLNINRQQIQRAVRAEPFPALLVVRNAATRAVQRYPLATAVVLLVGAVLVVRARPWRWLRPNGAMQLALAQLAWRWAHKALLAELTRPLPTPPGQASKKA